MGHEFESKHRGTWEVLEGGKGKGKTVQLYFNLKIKKL